MGYLDSVLFTPIQATLQFSKVSLCGGRWIPASPGLVEVEEDTFDVHCVSVCLECVLHAVHAVIVATTSVVAVDSEGIVAPVSVVPL